MKNTIVAFTVYFLTLFSVNVLAQNVVYPGKDRNDYMVKLLKHVLSDKYQSTTFNVKSYGVQMPKGRSYELLANNNGMDVVFGGSTLERETKYQPIRFPILKGLNGWRVPLIHKTKPYLFKQIDTVEKLNSLNAGLFHSWSDTKILQSNNLNVTTGSDYEGLYHMLHHDRFDYFPRSVLEVVWDYQKFKHLNIAIDKYALIHYPTAYYFYVRKGNQQLAAALKDGLEKSLQDGSLDKLFIEYYGDVVNRVKAENRHVINLENPFLSKETPLSRKELWVDLTAD